MQNLLHDKVSLNTDDMMWVSNTFDTCIMIYRDIETSIIKVYKVAKTIQIQHVY